ncbi:MAG: aspartate 1-decarboxylase [Dehalococcoidia bacterium]|nr:aspartate 1-decarboxylase [Dehalococcoidia bacterium]
MIRTMLWGKIHRATVTEANVFYRGSITIDEVLMEAANILPFEQVHVLDVNNGARLETYAIPAPRGSGVICVNGAAARLVRKGNVVIIMCYAQVTDAEARKVQPNLVFVDEENRLLEVRHDVPVEVPLR